MGFLVLLGGFGLGMVRYGLGLVGFGLIGVLVAYLVGLKGWLVGELVRWLLKTLRAKQIRIPKILYTVETS